MGGTLWELVKLIFYKEFNKKSIIWGKFFLKFSMISSDGFNHGLSWLTKVCQSFSSLCAGDRHSLCGRDACAAPRAAGYTVFFVQIEPALR